jgi:hypothetical protein
MRARMWRVERNVTNRKHGDKRDVINRKQEGTRNVTNRKHGDKKNVTNRKHGDKRNVTNWKHGDERNVTNRKHGDTRKSDKSEILGRKTDYWSGPGFIRMHSPRGISKSHDRTSQNSFWHFTVVQRASVSNFASRPGYWQQIAGQNLKTVHNPLPPCLSFPIYYPIITPIFRLYTILTIDSSVQSTKNKINDTCRNTLKFGSVELCWALKCVT